MFLVVVIDCVCVCVFFCFLMLVCFLNKGFPWIDVFLRTFNLQPSIQAYFLIQLSKGLSQLNKRSSSTLRIQQPSKLRRLVTALKIKAVMSDVIF